MKKQFSNLDELIQFIEISPFEEVDEFLKSHGVISQEPEKDVELLLFGEK